MTPEGFMCSLAITSRKYKHPLTSGTKSNPADITSYGTGAQKLVDNTLWRNGPDFLWSSPKDWDYVDDTPSIPPDDRGTFL